MVDFTKVVNTGDIVRGLNDLIRLNADVLAGLDAAGRAPSELTPAIGKLKAVHESHMERMSEVVRVLGGAADKQPDWRQWVSQGKALIGKTRRESGLASAIQQEEQKLQVAYRAKIDELKASPEAVDIINRLLEDQKENIEWLEQTIIKEGW